MPAQPPASGLSRPPAGQRAKKGPVQREKPLILIADDSPTVLDILKFILETNGMETRLAINGVEAVQMVYRELPDLVILDLEMPKMSGYQVCRLLKSDPTTSFIPIIILTSKSYKQNKFWGLYSGADDYLTKDFEIDQLVGRVRFHYGNRGKLTEIKHPVPKEINEEQIIENVNEALDQKLFETTIIFEIAQVALSAGTLDEKISKVLTLMNRVCDFTVASIFITEAGQGRLFLENPGMASETYIFNHVELVMLESQNFDMQFDTQKVMINQWETGTDRGGQYNHIQSSVSFPLKIRGVTQGLVSYSHYSNGMFPDVVSHLLKRAADQMAILVDEAILFQEYSKLRGDLLSHATRVFSEVMKNARETEKLMRGKMNQVSPWI